MTTTDALASKLLEIINQIQTGVVAHAPDAMNLALNAISVDGFQKILINLLALLVFITSVFCAIKLHRKALKKVVDKNREHYALDDAYSDLFFVVIPTYVGIMLGALASFGLFNVWHYVAILNPKLYLAHEIIQKVMQ